MDLALATLPVVTATVFATCAEAWVMADMIACVWISAARGARARVGAARGAECPNHDRPPLKTYSKSFLARCDFDFDGIISTR